MSWQVRPGPEGTTVWGEVSGEEGAELGQALLALPVEDEARLLLADLDLEDGVAVAHLVTALRALRSRSGRLVLVQAPQMLAHTLYKVGALHDPGLVAEGRCLHPEPNPSARTRPAPSSSPS